MSSEMTSSRPWPDAERKVVRKRCEKAIEGPWAASFPKGRDTQWLDIVVGPNDEEILSAETQPLPHVVLLSDRESVEEVIQRHVANLQFCANARTDLPRALSHADWADTKIGELEKQIEQLNWQLSENSGRDSYRESVANLEADLQRLREENAGLVADRERLDWLDSFTECGMVEAGLELDGGIHLTLSTLEDDREKVYREQNSFRAAIDAARSEKP